MESLINFEINTRYSASQIKKGTPRLSVIRARNPPALLSSNREKTLSYPEKYRSIAENLWAVGKGTLFTKDGGIVKHNALPGGERLIYESLPPSAIRDPSHAIAG